MEILNDNSHAWYSDNMLKLNDSKAEIVVIIVHGITYQFMEAEWRINASIN